MVVRSRLLKETQAAGNVAAANEAVTAKGVGNSSSVSASAASASSNAGDRAVAFAANGAPPGLPHPASTACDPKSKGIMPTWPLEKIKARLRCLARNGADEGEVAAVDADTTAIAEETRARRHKCILLSTGALNPVHRGHVRGW